NQRESGSNCITVCRLSGQTRRTDFGNRSCPATGSADCLNGIGEHLGLVRLNQIPAEIVRRRVERDRLPVNREYRVVTSSFACLLDLFVIKPVGHSETVDLDSQPLFEQLL